MTLRARWLLPALLLPWCLLLGLVAHHFLERPTTCVPPSPAATFTPAAAGRLSVHLAKVASRMAPADSLLTPHHLLARANCSSRPPPMAFLHLPKAGGSSIVHYMNQNLEPWCEEKHIAISSSFVSALQDGLARQLKPESHERDPPTARQQCGFSLLRAGPNGDARPAYAAMVLGEGFKVQYLMGHLPFGFCRLVDEGCTYITMLREPLQRLASHWGYLRHKHPDLLLRACGEACETLAGFATALAAGTAQAVLGNLDNMQTRMLAGDGFLAALSANKVCTHRTAGCDKSAPMTADRTMLDLAKRNLVRHFKVIGLLEDLPGFTSDMRAAFCFQRANVPGINMLGTGKRVMNTTAPHVLDLMRATQLFDIELYEFARRLIAKRRAVMHAA